MPRQDKGGKEVGKTADDSSRNHSGCTACHCEYDTETGFGIEICTGLDHSADTGIDRRPGSGNFECHILWIWNCDTGQYFIFIGFLLFHSSDFYLDGNRIEIV